MSDEKMPITAHLEELRKRLIVCIIALIVGFTVSYFFKEQLFIFIIKPLEPHLPEGSKLQYISLPEAFLTYLKLCLFSALFLALPVILYELWLFIAPGLFEKEKKYIVPFVLFSMIFFLSGASFCYFIVFPFVFKFFMAFSNESLHAMPTIRQYLAFSTRLLFAFGLVFEMPIFFFFLGRIGLVNYKTLAKQRRIAIVLIFLTAALLTPPDVISQTMLAGPLMILFELSLQIVRLTGKKPQEDAQKKETPAG